jgi:hypothetical protein
MMVIYIAGPYRSRLGEWGVRANICEAEKAALFVWQHGGVALCPHKNTALFGGAPGTTDETWLAGDLELLSRCDAVYAIPGWRESSGAVAELRFAQDRSIPILHTHQDVVDFLREAGD